ncbi:hypothetical protein DBV15_06431 [Temnothorax longispinosus]|uniref:Uncharacterized protein n=1 Tax=Temnothorax longispinosus TaxID=300112 RepID=A0A4S2KP07_9HYME|nr:hypothetical protein DBV15_06431 [Temnothorax longispinosus]
MQPKLNRRRSVCALYEQPRLLCLLHSSCLAFPKVEIRISPRSAKSTALNASPLNEEEFEKPDHDDEPLGRTGER